MNLKENTYVICADNDNAKIYNGTRRDPAQESRIKNFTFAPTDKEYLEDFARRVDAGLIHEAVLEFLGKFPEFIVLPTKTIEELSIQGKKGPSPRDWTHLGECLQQFRKENDDISVNNKNFLAEIAGSYVGFSYGMKFAEFKANPKLSVPTSHSLLELVKKTVLSEKQERNILTFLECCPNEAIAAFIKGWQKEMKEQFLSWRKTPKRFKVYNAAMLNRERKADGKSAYDNWVATFTKANQLTEQDLDRDDIIIAA